MRRYFFIGHIFFCLLTLNLKGQVNGYAKVTSISGTSLSLTNTNETFDAFTSGEIAIIMQMQDNVIGDVTNTSNFGNLGSIASVGSYEVVEIATVSGSPATSVTLVNAPINIYNTCVNCSVQLVTFPVLGGGGDFTTTSNISAVDWDGNIGGVVAFEVTGVLTLAHDISANGAGFQGGSMNTGGSTGCSGNSNFRVVTQANHANKGEGIYKIDLPTNSNYVAGMGKILNGGGGGNSHNAGGGGGSNYTGGGQGGPGWPTCSPSAGGLGGVDLSANIDVSRIFMGGGGGSGEGNNNVATSGGNGGGVVLVRADEISTTSSCGGRMISANGDTASSSPANDGAGGGGAGGSIVLEVAAYSIGASCTLTVEASGGNGGGVNDPNTHGGGGGGGQGVVFYSVVEPTSNITTTTNNGTGGCNNSSNPCNSAAGNGTGTDGSGIIDDISGPLPIELAFFKAHSETNRVRLSWRTLSELNNDFFTIERSSPPSYEGFSWKVVRTIPGAGNSDVDINYESYDDNPLFGRNFYRLKQTDFNGNLAYSDIVSIISELNFVVYPNPTSHLLNIVLENPSELSEIEISLFNSLGQRVPMTIKKEDSRIRIETTGLSNGIYWINVFYQEKRAIRKIVVIG